MALTGPVGRLAARLGLHLGRRRDHDLVERRFYSPVPDLNDLPRDIFERESTLEGISLDSAVHLKFAQRDLAGYFTEFETDHPDFDFTNAYYAAGDAHVAYGMVRHLRPRRIVELGSGYSTRVMRLACERNAPDGVETTYEVFDPYPPAGLSSVRAVKAQDVPAETFDRLESGDILFVDTSHTVKLGGDVNRVVLDVLPRLAPGVHVHFHDIWLPFEYHRTLVQDMQMYWAEQYLLQAFLTMNPSYEITMATRALSALEPDRFKELIPRWTSDLYPSSFWIRRL